MQGEPPVVCLLAGGRATRLPRKLQRRIHGQTLLARVHARFAAHYKVALSTAASDSVPDAGPLGGIVSVFERCEHERIFVVAADMPHADPRRVEQFCAAWSDELQAVVARTPAGWEPLYALYERRAFLHAARSVLRGSRAVTDVVAKLKVLSIDVPAQEAASVNTPQDFEMLLAREVRI